MSQGFHHPKFEHDHEYSSFSSLLHTNAGARHNFILYLSNIVVVASKSARGRVRESLSRARVRYPLLGRSGVASFGLIGVESPHFQVWYPRATGVQIPGSALLGAQPAS